MLQYLEEPNWILIFKMHADFDIWGFFKKMLMCTNSWYTVTNQGWGFNMTYLFVTAYISLIMYR